MDASYLSRVRQYLGEAVDGGSVAVFRIGFGALTAWIMYTFLRVNPDGTRLVETLYTPPTTNWHFPLPGFAWLQPYPAPWTEVLFYVCLVSACMVAVGLLYRLASVVMCLSFWHIMLMDSALYGNHIPLVAVFTVPLVFIPAHRRFSLDRLLMVGVLRKERPITVGFWCVLWLRSQTFLIYLFGGITKLHSDWFGGEPIRMWFTDDAMYGFLNGVLSPEKIDWIQGWLSTELFVYFFTYSGLVFDLTIGVLLTVRRTRFLAFAMATFFHSFNFFAVRYVGIVAPIAFWATLTFFEPDWPSRVWNFLKRPRLSKPDWDWFALGMIAVPGIGALLGWEAKPRAEVEEPAGGKPMSWPLFAVFLLWMTIQVLFPLRHFLIPDDPYWTEGGVRYSWFLMTRNKIAGMARFWLEDENLISELANGELEFDWEKYQGEKPPVIFFDVDPQTLRWSDLPEVFIAFEPMIGERIFYNSAASGIVSPSEIEARVEELWQSKYGHSGSVLPTYPLTRVLETLQRAATKAVREGEPDAELFLSVVLRAKERAKELEDAGPDDDELNRTYYSFKTSLFELQHVAAHAETILGILRQISPFALQGHPSGGPRPALILDPELLEGGEFVEFRVKRDAWKGDQTAYADFDLFPWPYMRGLPRALPTYRVDGTPSFVWNYGVELNQLQIQAIELLPPMFHRYAEHIAEEWESEQGHRPSVFGTSYVKLNDRPMQKIIDLEMDLAATPNRLMGPNPWILSTPERSEEIEDESSRSR